MTLYRWKKGASPSASPDAWILMVGAGTLLASSLAALVSLFLAPKTLALGFFLGGILSVVNFLGLKRLVERSFPGSERTDPRTFWAWNAGRWVLFALLCWGLLSISRECLLGALGSYLFFLGVLGWVGVKLKPASKIP